MCEPFDREPDTFDPLFNQTNGDDHTGLPRLPDVHHHALDQQQLGVKPEFKCQAHYLGNGDNQAGDWISPESGTRSPAADGSCLTECMPSWYPKDQPQDRQRRWICPPANVSSPDKGVGQWVPDPHFSRGGKALQCEMGKLDVKKSNFSIEENVETISQKKSWNSPIRQKGYPGGSLCQGFPGASNAHGTCFDGYTLAPRTGPTMHFYVTAYDTYGKSRNYMTLEHVGPSLSQKKDFLLAVIQRVPLDNLDPANKALQPRKIGNSNCDQDGTCLSDPYKLRVYPSTGSVTSDMEALVGRSQLVDRTL